MHFRLIVIDTTFVISAGCVCARRKGAFEMPEPYTPNPTHRRKRRPRWQRALRHYWPLIRLILILLVCVILIIFTVRAFTRSLDSAAQTPGSTTGDQSSDAPSDGEQPAEGEDQQPETPPAQATTEEADALIQKADFVAAGYDYQGAIELLQGLAGYESIQSVTDKIAEYQEKDSQLSVYQEMSGITHIFFHSLVVDNSRAFDGDAHEKGYNLYMTTIPEFKAILESLYERGYVLVTPYDVAGEVTDENGTHFAYREIRLPEGKTPFMMSQDDVNYYGYMVGAADGSGDTPVFATPQGDGFADKIVIGEDGYPTCEYMDADGNVTTGDYDLIPILERFIQEHPDFSYHGARAVIAFTGYEGVMGYRTKPAYEAAMGTEAYQQEVENAKAVAQCLRDHGWILASHSYGHPSYTELSAVDVELDSDKWEETVEPILGEVDILIYPHGAEIAGMEKYDFSNAKFSALYNDGFRYFFNVDNAVAWHQMGDNYFRGNRRDLDGYRMYHYPDSMNDLIDARAILDPDRPLPVPDIG